MSQFIEMFAACKKHVSLSSLCNVFQDGDWIESKDQSETGIRLIQTGNIGNGIFKDKGEKARYISEETFNRLNCTEIFEGDILVSRLPDPVGRACVMPIGLGKCITAVDCTIIRLGDKILPEYLLWFTRTPDYSMQIKKVLSGTTRLRVSRANLGNIKIPLPDIEQQSEFCKIAHQADKSEFVGFKSQFIEMFEGNKYPRLSLDNIAKEWLKGQGFKKDDICEDGNTKCIHYGELFTKYGPVITEVASRTYVEKKKISKIGDILFPASDVTPNGLARCSMLPFNDVILGGDIIVLRPKDEYSPAYLSYAINQQTSQLLTRVNGGVVKHMSAKGLKTVEIPIPPKDKQEEYIQFAHQADKSEYYN